MRALLLTLVLLTGCSYSHPTKNENEFDVDITECRSKFAAAYNDPFFGDWVAHCMKSKGWTR